MATAAGLLNRYIEGNGWFHRVDARVKLVVTLCFIFATTSIPPGVWPAIGVMIGLVWTAALFSRLGVGRVFLRSLIAVPFILIALPTVFTKPGEAIASFDLTLFTLTATDAGLVFFVSVLLKSWTSVTAATLLTATTPPLQLLEALRALRLPAVLVAIVMLMYRYLFVLVDESSRLMRARTARSAAVGSHSGGSVVWRAKSAGGMAGSLFIRTLDRSERIYFAMLARGFDGEIKGQRPEKIGYAAMAQIGLPLIVFAGVAVAARLMG
jgi:cobalt/nickel transport system permease protein